MISQLFERSHEEGANNKLLNSFARTIKVRYGHAFLFTTANEGMRSIPGRGEGGVS